MRFSLLLTTWLIKTHCARIIKLINTTLHCAYILWKQEKYILFDVLTIWKVDYYRFITTSKFNGPPEYLFSTINLPLRWREILTVQPILYMYSSTGSRSNVYKWLWWGRIAIGSIWSGFDRNLTFLCVFLEHLKAWLLFFGHTWSLIL